MAGIWKRDRKVVPEPEESQKTDVRREILEWLASILVAVGLAWFVSTFLIINATVPSASMETTIMTGDRIIGNRLAYLGGEPERGDVIIFRYPDNEKQRFVKRIIGLPGETLQVVDGSVYIDGNETPLEEPYLKETPVGDYGPVTVPEGAYFVMGDNRNNSRDSRYWVNPFVYRKKILGKAVYGYWPSIQKID